jgi:hypothetical protein
MSSRLTTRQVALEAVRRPRCTMLATPGRPLAVLGGPAQTRDFPRQRFLLGDRGTATWSRAGGDATGPGAGAHRLPFPRHSWTAGRLRAPSGQPGPRGQQPHRQCPGGEALPAGRYDGEAYRWHTGPHRPSALRPRSQIVAAGLTHRDKLTVINRGGAVLPPGARPESCVVARPAIPARNCICERSVKTIDDEFICCQPHPHDFGGPVARWL